MSTNVQEFISDLDGGVFEEKLSKVLSDVAGAVVDHDVAGKVNITIDIKRIGNSHQVMLAHKLSYSRPTSKGKISEDNTTSTPMYVGPQGALTLFAPNQTQMFDKKGNVTEGEK